MTKADRLRHRLSPAPALVVALLVVAFAVAGRGDVCAQRPDNKMLGFSPNLLTETANQAGVTEDQIRGTGDQIRGAEEQVKGTEDPVLDFTLSLAESNVAFDYTYVMEGGKVDVTGRGSIVLQGRCYYIEGDGMRIWCDGSSVWTMDVGANEAVIESSDNANGFTADPILILADCDRLYSWDKTGKPVRFADVPCSMFTLKAKEMTEFDTVRLYLSEGALVGAALQADGICITFTVSSFAFRPIDNEAVFVPGTFPDDCIVTDLR